MGLVYVYERLYSNHTAVASTDSRCNIYIYARFLTLVITFYLGRYYTSVYKINSRWHSIPVEQVQIQTELSRPLIALHVKREVITLAVTINNTHLF